MIPSTVCILVLHPSGKVLATPRRNRSDLWGLVGGKMEDGEHSLQAAHRELYEETGLFARMDWLLPVFLSRARNSWCQTFLLNYPVLEVPGPSNPEELTPAFLDATEVLGEPFGTFNLALFEHLQRHVAEGLAGPMRDLLRNLPRSQKGLGSL